MTEDIVKAFGFLTLGSRMKRIGDRLQADATRIAAAYDVPLQAGQYIFLAALDRHGPMTIGELAEAAGITQPGATRSVAQLAGLQMVKVTPGRKDQRRRVVSLSPKGREQVAIAQREVWPQIEAAVTDLCAGLSGPLLRQLAAIEDGLAERPLDRRVAKLPRRRA